MDFAKFAAAYLDELKTVLDGFETERFTDLIQALLAAYEDEKQIFIMGNGGSGSTASHFVCDLNKGCCLDLGKKFKVICLNDNLPSLLAYANDISYDAVFVEQLKNFFKEGDLVIGISGSGNSENVLQAIRYAGANGGKTAGISGYAGGKLADLVDIPFVARVDDMQKVEDVHMIVVHMIMQAVYANLHPDSPTGKPC
jgi:D-sedoheptulose 7-phosphate isomerase